MRSLTAILIAATTLSLTASDPAFAQAPEGAFVLPSDVTIRDIGWSQIGNVEEISEFFLAVLETLVFVAAFAFHPRANALRENAQGGAFVPACSCSV